MDTGNQDNQTRKGETMKTMRIRGYKVESAHAAIQEADAAGGQAVMLPGGHYVVNAKDLGAYERAGGEFAFLYNIPRPDCSCGQIVTVPVN